MNKKTKSKILTLFLFAILAGCQKSGSKPTESDDPLNLKALNGKTWAEHTDGMTFRFYGDSSATYIYPDGVSNGEFYYDSIACYWHIEKPAYMQFATQKDGSTVGGFDVISITDTLFKAFLSTTLAGITRSDTLYFRVVK